MAAGRTSVPVKTMHKFMTGLEPGAGPMMDPNPPTKFLPWIHFEELPGIADPPACAARSEAILTPTMACMKAVGDPHAGGEVRHRSVRV